MQGRCGGEQAPLPPMTQAAERVARAIAKSLFDKLGPARTVFLRVGFAALLSSIYSLKLEALRCLSVSVFGVL